MKIKANKELFNSWLRATEMIRSLSVIVQNDTNLGHIEFNEWKIQARTAFTDIAELYEQTIKYIEEAESKT